jgi:hypothetical protein
MQKKLFSLQLLLLLFFSAQSQIYIEPYAGFQVDLNNTRPLFKQINTGLQCSFKRNRRYEFLMQVQVSNGLANKSADSAFTSNTSLPVYTAAAKKITPVAVSFALLNRVIIGGNAKGNTFYIVPGVGYMLQNINVEYSYDKANYTILNPDKTFSHSGVYLCLGATWVRTIKDNRFFATINFNTPSLSAKMKYPSSFNFLIPAAINAGYSFNISKSKK